MPAVQRRQEQLRVGVRAVVGPAKRRHRADPPVNPRHLSDPQLRVHAEQPPAGVAGRVATGSVGAGRREQAEERLDDEHAVGPARARVVRQDRGGQHPRRGRPQRRRQQTFDERVGGQQRR